MIPVAGVVGEADPPVVRRDHLEDVPVLARGPHEPGHVAESIAHRLERGVVPEFVDGAVPQRQRPAQPVPTEPLCIVLADQLDHTSTSDATSKSWGHARSRDDFARLTDSEDNSKRKTGR